MAQDVKTCAHNEGGRVSPHINIEHLVRTYYINICVLGQALSILYTNIVNIIGPFGSV